jgi:hypothetical protein
VGEKRRDGSPLAFGKRPKRFVLPHSRLGKERATTHIAPTVLADEQLADRHSRGLPRAGEDHIGSGHLSRGDASLQLGALAPNSICLPQRAKRLGGRCGRMIRVFHRCSPVLSIGC